MYIAPVSQSAIVDMTFSVSPSLQLFLDSVLFLDLIMTLDTPHAGPPVSQEALIHIVNLTLEVQIPTKTAATLA